MYLRRIKINNFRNLEKIDFQPEGLISYFYSPNGTGKTNLLEAIQCVTVGKTLRAKSENDLMSLESSKDLYTSGEFKDEDDIVFSQTYFLELLPNSREAIKKKKTLLINKTKVNINEFVGRVPSIWFSPESIKIINSSPKSKREYFDQVLIQLYPDYIYNLRSFNRSLRQRNKLLQEKLIKLSQIRVWTEQLIKYGANIIKTRQRFFEILNTILAEIDYISRYKFQVEYEANVKTHEIFDEDTAFRYREELRKFFDRDKRMSSTTVGPHRDDWQMLIKLGNSDQSTHSSNKNNEFIRADKFASRGQQRMSLIVLQLALIKLFERTTDKKPILLLDDIFSELDTENEKILLEIIEHNQIQSFITGVGTKEFSNIQEYDLRELKKEGLE